MKKLLSAALVLCMALSLTVTAFAVTAGYDNFTVVTNESIKYTDVSNDYWAASVIASCHQYGLMNGTGSGRFEPKSQLTVAQALVMADRVHEIYATGATTLTNGTPWYQPYVDYAIKNGIIKSGDFSDYNRAITRAEMAYVFYNSLPENALPNNNGITSIPDVKANDPHYAEILALYNVGALTGSDIYGTFKPNDNIIRAEAAAILARVALPQERKEVVLFKDVTILGNVKLAVPTDLTASTQDGVTILSPSSSQALVTALSTTDDVYSGSDITIIPPDQMNSILETALASQGQSGRFDKTEAVSYGAVKAYRSTGSAVFNGVPAESVVVSYISGSTLSMIFFIDVGDGSLLSSMTGSLTIGGASVSK